MISIIKSIILNIINAHEPYAGNSMMMALFFMSLMIVIFYGKDNKLKKAVIVPIVIMMGILYIGIPLFISFGGTYQFFYVGRTFWIMITPIVTAFGLTMFICGIDNPPKQLLAVCLFFPIFLYCGTFKLSNDMFVKPENAYRLPQSTVDITEHIISETDTPRIIVPYTIAHPFRQISTDVYLLYGEDASFGRIKLTSDDLLYVSYQMELITPDLNYIVPLAKDYDVDYILFDTVYTEFCEEGNINVYGYPVDENYVADRTATVTFDELKSISVVDNEKGIYWDLSEYGLEYDGTFGQYILYKFV